MKKCLRSEFFELGDRKLNDSIEIPENCLLSRKIVLIPYLLKALIYFTYLITHYLKAILCVINGDSLDLIESFTKTDW